MERDPLRAPKSWAGTLAVGIAFKFLMKAIVMPLLSANPINQAYPYLVGNRAALPAAIVTMIVVAGFGEETVFPGQMFERASKLLDRSLAARIVTVLVAATLFVSLDRRRSQVLSLERSSRSPGGSGCSCVHMPPSI